MAHYSDKVEKLRTTLETLGFSIVFSDTPLKVQLEQVKYPVAIVTFNNAMGDTDLGYIQFAVGIALLWTNYSKLDDYENFLYACNQAAGIATAMEAQEYNVTPIQHHSPDVSGGLLTMIFKANVTSTCDPADY